MADIYTTPNLTWTAGNLSVANLNQYIRDNMDALKQGLVGDASADTDIKQAIKSGTLAARPAASLAGRQYYATDIKQSFIDDGTAWQHVSGSGVFDSFDRANVEPIGPADSGHAWTEVGDIDIASNNAQPQAANALMTVDTGAPLRTAHYGMQIQVGNVVADLDASLILRYVDASNMLYVRLHGGSAAMQIVKVIAGAGVSVDSVAVTFTASAIYFLDVSVRGPVVAASLRLEPATGGGSVELEHSVLADTYSAGGLSGATRTGLKFGTAVGAGNQWVIDYFCIPNA